MKIIFSYFRILPVKSTSNNIIYNNIMHVYIYMYYSENIENNYTTIRTWLATESQQKEHSSDVRSRIVITNDFDTGRGQEGCKQTQRGQFASLFDNFGVTASSKTKRKKKIFRSSLSVDEIVTIGNGSSLFLEAFSRATRAAALVPNSEQGRSPPRPYFSCERRGERMKFTWNESRRCDRTHNERHARRGIVRARSQNEQDARGTLHLRWRQNPLPKKEKRRGAKEKKNRHPPRLSQHFSAACFNNVHRAHLRRSSQPSGILGGARFAARQFANVTANADIYVWKYSTRNFCCQPRWL